jgi:hypothetical protein
MTFKCDRCNDTGWVCESHIARPWEGPNACGCGAAGAPCGRCNRAEGKETPRLPDAMTAKLYETLPCFSPIAVEWPATEASYRDRTTSPKVVPDYEI